MPTYAGRLELTWTNKHLRLLAHDDGSYEWVPPTDYRVAEVRLLRDRLAVGCVAARARDNLVIRGDALHALTSLASLPEFARSLAGRVRLAYLDPPFNTQQSFINYDDNLEHSVWLTMMRDRLVQISKLLSPDASVWVHCDDSEQSHLRVLMDEIFGAENFIATFVWQKTLTRRNDARLASTAHDYLVTYAKALDSASFNRLETDAKQRATYTNRDGDPRGDWLAIPFHAPNLRPNLTYPIETPSGRVLMPPAGRCWSTTKERFEALLADNRIYFGKSGDGMAQRKKFWGEGEHSLVPWTWWPYSEVGENREANREAKAIAAFSGLDKGFATPKPERLLSRIIQIATDPGDLVLDCFLGSGTTAAVAHKMGRRWIGIERSSETVDTFVLPRLTKVVEGLDPGGATELAGWQGRSRLAVIDGVVNEAVVRLLVRALPDEERLVVCGTGIDTSVRSLLRELRSGSTLRKIPAALLDAYRSSNQLQFEPGDSPLAATALTVSDGVEPTDS
jgi:adenine-specific DNA-methyltransferase